MAAPLKDIVSMFETEKHRTSAERAFEQDAQRFADTEVSENSVIVSEECNEFVNNKLQELLN